MATLEEHVTDTTLVEVFAMSIKHPAIASEHIITHPSDVTAVVDGVDTVFKKGSFDFQGPNVEADQGNQSYKLKIDDQHGALMKQVDLMIKQPSPIEVMVYAFYESTLSNKPTPASGDKIFISSIEWSDGAITAQAIGLDYLQYPFPPNRYLTSVFPYLIP